MSKNEIVTLAIAAIALGFSIWQGNSQIEHNHVSVEPRVTSYFSNHGPEGKWGIYIINNGMGTAFVKSLDIKVNGKSVSDHEFGKFYQAVVDLDLNPMCFIMGAPRPNDSFQVGEEVSLIESNEKAKQSCARDYLLLREYQKNKLDYELVIESIYGDTFTYKYSKNQQVKI
ncbi:hypothetical protein [Photobacterium damselae]|uniref:Uncharacterized protein n=3 Tax=Photobacterium damselae TaxID=38293 RepID=D0Z599_PHODD|nr:hypothetical protein [Photobacterium damselae]EEZ39133.1 hypothetical protein VDA_000149 [Photobacterium damselae subsp. damselae CIP 102761]KAB1181425.1 hypothetical protein F6477_05115 [Photobacterium damselae subsp. damselae]MBF7101132.1 hypothetical protein [Photobacterium damselae]NVO75201.1 hypothetical protein [Photobacterium damselae subsp. damselae]PSB83454.1 hypothetical protein C5F63_18865 [Photobacterium damselae subsp. damselae]